MALLANTTFDWIDPPLQKKTKIFTVGNVVLSCGISSSLPFQELQARIWTNVRNQQNPDGEWHNIDMSYKRTDENGKYVFELPLLIDTTGRFEYGVSVGMKEKQDWKWASSGKTGELNVTILPFWIKINYRPSNRCESYDTLMYVEQINQATNEGYGWIRATAYDPAMDPSRKNTPWDFSNLSDSIPNTYVFIKRTWSLESMQVKYDSSTLELVKGFVGTSGNTIYRISDDYKSHYGDGGETFLVYPIWKCDHLAVSQNTKNALTDILHQLSESRKDYQKQSPVEDIIDPDLAPYLIPNHQLKRELVRLAEIAIGSEDETDYYEGEPEEMTRGELVAEYIANFSEKVTLRSSYQWIPSEFVIHPNRKVSITSPIHNLPRDSTNQTLYEYIEEVFEAMVPMFAKLNLIKTDQETNLQVNFREEFSDRKVIVKAQSYNLRPGMSYAGRWHMEGQTENIVAAGVYYPHVGSELQGGNLKFRPSHAPQPMYEIKTDHEIPIKEGTAVVFSNTVPHRFRKIINHTETTQRRTFINFFIVDPSQPIPSTKSLSGSGLTSDFLCKVMKHYVTQRLHKTLPQEIASLIVSQIPGLWTSTASAKEFRQEARQAMIDDKTGWGWIHWGNCGHVDFVSSRSTMNRDDAEEFGTLQHTDSDLNEESSIK